jgi:hypothetical protein
MDANRQIHSCRPFREYSMEGLARQYAHQTNLTPSPSKTGDYSNLISTSVIPLSPAYMSSLLTSEIFAQPDSVHTVEDALAHISQPQPVQVRQSSPSDVTKQVQIEAFPSVLILHLKRFLYDAAADGIVKISKPVLFAPELEIPLGTNFSFVSPVPRLRITRFQKLWHPFPGNLENQRTTSYMVCSIIMATPRAAGTIRSTCSTGAETAVLWEVGCTSMVKLFARCDTRTCLGSMAMSGWTTTVLTCCFIVALLLRHNDLFHFYLA